MGKGESRVVVTGAAGFIGSALLRALEAGGAWDVRGTVRSQGNGARPSNLVAVGDLAGETNWRPALKDARAVVHTAARVHMMDDRTRDPMAAYRRTNVEATLNLARQAAHSGVRRFVFLSSVKVNGDSTPIDRPFNPGDLPKPVGSYAVSKHEAEEGLRQIENESGLEVIILRPVLVYGPGVKANFHSMMRWIDRGIPLPFGAIRNARSLLALDNLVDLVDTCLRHPAALGQTFLVSDGEDLSTPELLRRTASAMGRRARLLPVPEFLLRSGATLAGRRDVGERLCGSLRVNIQETQRRLGWSPPIPVNQALEKTARYFFDQKIRH